MASHAALALFTDDSPLARRGAQRHRVLMAARLITIAGEHEVRLRDLSGTGALAEGDVPPAGTDVVLRRGRTEVFATIIWSDGRRGGLAFDAPLAPADLFAHLRGGAPPPVPALPSHRRPGFGATRLSPREEALAAAWFRPEGRPSLGD